MAVDRTGVKSLFRPATRLARCLDADDRTGRSGVRMSGPASGCLSTSQSGINVQVRKNKVASGMLSQNQVIVYLQGCLTMQLICSINDPGDLCNKSVAQLGKLRPASSAGHHPAENPSPRQRLCATRVTHNRVVKETGSHLDPRQARTRARVYAAALDVLRRQGIGATTFDAIAQQAGVARSTLYRNWATRDELLREAIEEQAPFPVTSPGEPTAARLESALQEIAAALSTGSWGAIMPAALAAVDASPALADGYERFMTGLRGTFTAIIGDGKKAGELPGGLGEEEFIDALIGPLFFRRLIRKLPADPAWIHRHLQQTLAAFAGEPDRAHR